MPFRDTFQLGSCSIIAQSGGVGGAMLNTLANEHLGFNKFASVGNKLDTNENDLLEYYLEDEGTKTIFLYLEGIADGRRLMEIAFQSSKPILVHKSNTSEKQARHIARSHSSSLSAAEEVVNAAFHQCSILRVTDMNSTILALKAPQSASHAWQPSRGCFSLRRPRCRRPPMLRPNTVSYSSLFPKIFSEWWKSGCAPVLFGWETPWTLAIFLISICLIKS